MERACFSDGKLSGAAGFFAVILGGLGIGSVLQVHLRSRHATAAILRCMGASTGQFTSIYLIQSIGMGVIVGVAACIIGFLGQLLVPIGLGDILPIDIPFYVSPRGVGIGLGVSILATLTFH